MYALAQYVPRRNQKTLAAAKIGDSRFGRRVTSHRRVDLHAVSITHRPSEQNQRRVQGQPQTGPHHCSTTDETTTGGHRSANLEGGRQLATFISGAHGRGRAISRRSKEFTPSN